MRCTRRMSSVHQAILNREIPLRLDDGSVGAPVPPSHGAVHIIVVIMPEHHAKAAPIEAC